MYLCPELTRPHPMLQSGFWVVVCYCAAHAKSRGCNKNNYYSQRHNSVTCRIPMYEDDDRKSKAIAPCKSQPKLAIKCYSIESTMYGWPQICHVCTLPFSVTEPPAPCQTAGATTVGGCMFEQLTTGSQKNYACDNLADIDGNKLPEIKKAASRLIDHAKMCLIETDRQRSPEEKVVKFYIGKASIHRRKRGRSGKAVFDRRKSNTWKKTGISSRWSDHKKKPYGKDGMFVLAAISRKSLPPQCRQTGKSKRHQEDYALALEQSLIHHFMFDEADERLENTTTTSGRSDRRKSIAYALYMAFAVEENTDPLDTSGSSDNSESPHYSDLTERSETSFSSDTLLVRIPRGLISDILRVIIPRSVTPQTHQTPQGLLRYLLVIVRYLILVRYPSRQTPLTCQVPPSHHQIPPSHHQIPPSHHQIPPSHHQTSHTRQIPPSHQIPQIPLSQTPQDSLDTSDSDTYDSSDTSESSDTDTLHVDC